MCYGCWQRYGAPEIDNEKVRAIADLLPDADRFGALHIVVEDWNLEDEHLDWSKDHGADYGSEWTSLDEEIYQAMKAATVEERASAMRRARA